MPQVIYPSGGGGLTPGSSCSSLAAMLVLGEDVASGDVLRIASSNDPGFTTGTAVRAMALNGHVSDAIGVAASDGLLGDKIKVIFDGYHKISFAAPVPQSSLSKNFYLSSANPGKVTLIPSTNPGDSIVPIGKILFSDGISLEVECVIDIGFVTEIS